MGNDLVMCQFSIFDDWFTWKIRDNYLVSQNIFLIYQMIELNNHPLKWEGLKDRTESPVTGRLTQPVDLQVTCLYQIHHWGLVQNDVPNIP